MTPSGSITACRGAAGGGPRCGRGGGRCRACRGGARVSPCRGGRCPSRALVLWGGKERGVSGGSGAVTDTSLPRQSHGIGCHGWGPLPHRNGSGCPQGPPCWEGHTETRGGDTLGPGGTHTYKDPPGWHPCLAPPASTLRAGVPPAGKRSWKVEEQEGGKEGGGHLLGPPLGTLAPGAP